MNDLKGQEGELKMTVQVTRKATGKVEEYELVSHITDDELKQLTKGKDNGSNTLDLGA